MLHGYSGEISEFRNTFGMGLTDIIEVYVNGRKDNKGWRYWSAFGPDWGGACGGWENCGDHDVAYLRRVVETAIDTYNVDVNRVYVLGHSNGAAMALRLACDAADLFSAAVSVEERLRRKEGSEKITRVLPRNPSAFSRWAEPTIKPSCIRARKRVKRPT